MRHNHNLLIAVLLGSIASVAPLALAQFRVRNPMLQRPAGPGTVNLPYITADAQGNQWMVYGPGTVQMQGNSPVFSQAGQLLVNNMQAMATTNTGRIDDKTGELILDNMSAGQISITRRLLIKPDAQTVRFVDVFNNPTNAPQTLNLRWTTNLNFGVQTASLVPDPKRKGQNLAWVAQTNNNQAAFEWTAASGAKVAPALAWTMNQSFLQSTLALTVPANGKAAVVRVDGATDTTATANKWIDEVKPRSLLADLPNDIRQIIVNVPARVAGLGTDVELLRGDLLDVVELRGGDRIVGTINVPSFKVMTLFGTIEIPADHLLGVVASDPLPLWVMSDGQVLSGPTDAPALQLATAGGGAMPVAWSTVARVGFRRQQVEAADAAESVPTLAAPAVVLTTGDRLKLSPPTDAVDVLTRYGPLHIPVDAIGSIGFTDAESPVDVITLTDGSRFTGLMTARTVAGVAPLLGSNSKPTSFDVARVSMLQLHDAPDDATAADAPTLATTTSNSFVGKLQQPVTLHTSAGSITLDADVIASVAPVDDDAGYALKIATADGTTLTGRPTDDQWLLRTTTGLDLKVPVAEIKSYTNPAATPSAMSRSGLDPWIALLNADDWKQRDAAEHELVKLGPAVAPTLRQARDKQPPEAQQRIDSVLKQIEAADRTRR